MKIKSLLTFLSRGDRTASVADALARLLSPSDLKTVLHACPDSRLLVETVAQMTEQEEEGILELVAEQLKLPLVKQIAPVNLGELPKRFSHSSLLELGAIPAVNEGRVTGMICADPACLSEDYTNYQLSLGSYSSIVEALNVSEQLYYKTLWEERTKRSKENRALALKALQMIANECFSHGGEVVSITTSEDEVMQYSFLTPKGKRAVGTVNQRVKGAVEELLFDTPESETYLKSLPRFSHISIEEAESSVELSFAPQPTAVEEKVASDEPVRALESTPTPTPVEELPEHCVEPLEIAPASAGQKVLIVDDNEVFSLVLSRFVSRLGLVPVTACDGKRAIRLIQQLEEPPVAIVCDVHMPYMNGVQFVSKLRKIEILSDVPIIMLTSDENVETELELVNAGADAFLRKSQDPRLLTAYVGRLVEKRRKAA